jgi:hypothetical protein
MRRAPQDPFREAILKRLKVEHLRETPINNMFDLGKWTEKMRGDSFYYNDFVNGMGKWNKMNTYDQESFARLTSHFPNAEWEEVARIPHEINELLWRMHPDLLEDQERAMEWLDSESGRPYKVPEAARRPFSFNKQFAVSGR